MTEIRHPDFPLLPGCWLACMSHFGLCLRMGINGEGETASAAAGHLGKSSGSFPCSFACGAGSVPAERLT